MDIVGASCRRRCRRRGVLHACAVCVPPPPRSPNPWPYFVLRLLLLGPQSTGGCTLMSIVCNAAVPPDMYCVSLLLVLSSAVVSALLLFVCCLRCVCCAECTLASLFPLLRDKLQLELSHCPVDSNVLDLRNRTHTVTFPPCSSIVHLKQISAHIHTYTHTHTRQSHAHAETRTNAP